MTDMPNPMSWASVGVSAAGDILGALLNYFGMNKQLDYAKQQAAQQQQNYQQQMAVEQQQFGQQFGEQQRQFNVGLQMKSQELGQQYQLSTQGLKLQEKGLNAQIAESQASRADALKQKKLEDSIALFGHITNYLNTPAMRSQLASMYAGGK